VKLLKKLEVRTPDQVFARLQGRVPAYIKLCFSASMVLGFAAHMFVFTNKLPNHDDIGHLFEAGYGTYSGRWLLPTVLEWDGPFSIPWLIGLLGLLCLAGTVCLTAALLRIRRPLECVVTAGLMTAFPTVAGTFGYMFTADAYFLGLLLAAFGAWAASRMPKAGIPIGAAAICLSMGIYQSYFPVAAALCVGTLIFDVLDGKMSFKELIIKGVKQVAALALGMAAYMVIVKITTRETGLVDYMGISTMGQLPISELPGLIFKSYKEYLYFFLKNDSGFHFWFIKYIVPLSGLCTAALLVLLLSRSKLGAARSILVIVLVMLYPLAGHLIYIMTAGGEVHDLMRYGTVLLPVATVALAGYACRAYLDLSVSAQWLRAVTCWVILGSMALTAYSYMVADNKIYLKMELSYEQAYAYSNRLLTAIESCEGYSRGLPVALVGSSAMEQSAMYPTPQLDSINVTGAAALRDFRISYTYGEFLRFYLGFPDPVYLDGTELVDGLAERPEVAAMPLYPQEGSIKVIDNTVVVKLN